MTDCEFHEGVPAEYRINGSPVCAHCAVALLAPSARNEHNRPVEVTRISR